MFKGRLRRSAGKPNSDLEKAANAWGWLATLGLAVVAAVAGQIPALAALSWSHEYGFSLAKLAGMASDGVAVIILVCVSTPIQIGLLFVFARQRSSSARDYLALTIPHARDIVVLILAAAALGVVGEGLSWFLGSKIVTPFQNDIYLSARAAGALLWLWLTVVVVAPIGEESLFRGFLFRGWQRSPNDPWVAIGATALIWAVVHIQYDPLIVGQILIVGLILGWVRWITGSTISTFLLHALLNAAGMTETYIAIGG
jgi:membrane protease YdiL (CAAX protease family)